MSPTRKIFCYFTILGLLRTIHPTERASGKLRVFPKEELCLFQFSIQDPFCHAVGSYKLFGFVCVCVWISNFYLWLGVSLLVPHGAIEEDTTWELYMSITQQDSR